MTDFYELLGVDRDADRKEIRQAYRIKAKTAHPDTGGDEDEFNELKRAYDTLMDAGKRAFYDEHGDAPPDTPHTPENAELYMLVDGAFSWAMSSCDIFHNDLVNNARGKLAGDQAAIKAQITQYEKELGNLRSVIDRIGVVEGENMLVKIITPKIASTEAGLDRMRAAVAVMEKAIEMLKNYTYRTDGEKKKSSMTYESLRADVEKQLGRHQDRAFLSGGSTT